ncbi:hypothetical protein J2Z21_007697 [Streptomyces griseochromogenes]|uniref:BioF2-like acetyltransferase domain-containing protein n=1 Tax=Streptomyces griseochromogenes TaxID=68214 RepID=A0A1B1B3T7_9ACTN|nr:GNAT family N-acetyltransferase [Streptomyces griseochromogenes]ANP53486.1 hypothetical protein AVL59_31645 [Streptomyces griseochromogenes]MBP2054687.1 hypothetical protein [Streptomyces griseochromogenes]
MTTNTIHAAARPHPEWENLTGTAPFYLGAAWLRFIDSAGGAEPRYRVLVRDRHPVAALAAHWNPDESHPDYRAQEVLAEAGPPRLTLGGRRGYRSGLLHAPGAGPDSVTADLAELLADAVEDEPRAEGRWWWPFLTTDESDLVLAAARRARPSASLQLRLVGADCVMDVVGDGVDDFVAALPAKQRRTNFRREQRRYADSGLRSRRLRLSQVWEEAAELHAQVQRKYGHDTSVEHLRGFLRRLADQLDDLSVVFAAYDGDRMIGFTLCFAIGGELTVRLNGLDYAHLADADEYAQLTVHEPLRYCYENGLRRLHLGMDSYDAKCRRGARVRPLWAVVGEDPAADTTSRRRLDELAAAMPEREAELLVAEVTARLTAPDAV